MAPSNSSYNPQGTVRILNRLQPGIAFIVIIFSALVAFELFNYSTTEHALRDLLGDLQFAGFAWATILAFAFCGIDFAGIARMFTPEQGVEEPKEVWYLFGAWLLAATMNAILTWWGVSIAVMSHVNQSSTVLRPEMVNQVVPIFVAVMVWVIRILIIGTLSLALDRALHPGAEQQAKSLAARRENQPRMPAPPQTVMIPTGLQSAGMQHQANPGGMRPAGAMAASATPRAARSGQPSAVEPAPAGSGRTGSYPEATYHTLTASGRRPGSVTSPNSGNSSRRF